MARPLDRDSLSLTAAGAGLVTDADGSIRPDAVSGLIVDDRRVISRWQLDIAGASMRRAGWHRVGASTDELLFTLGVGDVIDPVAVLVRRRTVDGRGFQELISITAYAVPLRMTVTLMVARDDQPVFHLGDAQADARPATTPQPHPSGGVLPPPGEGSDVTVECAGWHFDDGRFVVDVELAVGETWTTTIAARVDGHRDVHPRTEPTSMSITTSPPDLGLVVDDARADLRALVMPVGERDVVAAGSPFFLALFGRDSMIAGMQNVLDSHRPLVDVLALLAEHQAVERDELTGAQPGRILHELRLGREGVFGVSPGTPYYGAVDTSALFVVALGEAARWGAPRDEIAALLPAARAALRWCTAHGDVDGDGFVESVPHPSGLTNLGWKDSSDSIIDAQGSVFVGRTALAEVQAYWYRALRTLAELERWTGTGDGEDHDRDAAALAERFVAAFVYETDAGPFVGLALDDRKQLLTVRTSNAGHVLWSGVLPHPIADSVASQLAGDDLFSGWGVRTVGARAAGYNPFGYHRGSVWPHDTAMAMHGAARIGRDDVVRTLGAGLLALGLALGGQLPELLSGIGRADVDLPVPYAAACRPQAWAAGAILMATRALLGLEPDATTGTLLLRPCLPDGMSIEVRNAAIGESRVSFTVRGSEILDLDAPGWDVVTGDAAILARGGWGPP